MSVNSLLSKAHGVLHERCSPTLAAPGHGRFLWSARRPCHRPAAQHVRVRVRDGLPALPSGIEHDPVAGAVDPLSDGDLVRLADDLVKQAVTRAGESRHVWVVVARNHQDMRGRLRADVTESDYPLTVQHDRGLDLSGRDPAEQAVWHSTIIVARQQYPVQAWLPVIRGT